MIQIEMKRLLHKKWHEMSQAECIELWTALEDYLQRPDNQELMDKLLNDQRKIKKEHHGTFEAMLRKASKQLSTFSKDIDHGWLTLVEDPRSDAPGVAAGDPSSSAYPFYDPARGSAQPEM